MTFDSLHLFPTLPTLVGIWTLCVACHLVLRLVAAPRKTRGRVWTAAAASKTRQRGLWPWTLCDDGATPLWRWLLMRAGFHRASVWKMVSRRSMVATLALAVVVVSFNSAMLYLRTGSWMEQSYEWYSLKATGARVFAESVNLPAAILDTCIVHAKEVESSLRTVDDVISTYARGVKQRNTVIYVVPYGWTGIVDISDAQVRASNHTRHHHAGWHEVLRGAAAVKTAEYARIMPVDSLTMFPYVWHSILSSGFSDKVRNEMPWERRVDEANLTYKLVKNQAELDNLSPGSNVFAIVQSMENSLRLADSLPVGSRVGYVALSKEDCNNPGSPRYSAHPNIRFGMFPYGDCSIVDNDRFSVIPLGPSFEHGFPINTHETTIPSVAERSQLLNLMVSWTVEKPTRIQAMMAALQVCDTASSSIGLGCIIEHNDLAFKMLQKVDDSLGLDLRWMLSSAPNAYVGNLKQSIFTLCPFGKNPEQYRIWEALAAGSIPIVEDMPTQDSSYSPGSFYHPSYPTTWKCRPDSDVHGFLKRKNAPVIFVTDWRRDLPRVIQHYTVDHPQELVDLQLRAKNWYRQASEHLQAELIAQSLRFFSPESNHQ